MSRVHADIDALQGLHEALTRFRQALREVADRGDDRIEAARASLQARADQCRFRLEQDQAELQACRSRAAQASEGSPGDPLADCSGYARAVSEGQERLERVRRWQQRVEEEASEFRVTATRFRSLLEADLPRTEEHLLAIIAHLQAARRVPVGGS